MSNQSSPINPENEKEFEIVSTAAAKVSWDFLVLCPETSSNYPYTDRIETLSNDPHPDQNFCQENTSPKHFMADLKLGQSSKYITVAETPVTAKSEVMIGAASAKARSPSVSSNRSSSSSSTATAAQTPRFLKVCPVHYGRGDGPDDFSPA